MKKLIFFLLLLATACSKQKTEPVKNDPQIPFCDMLQIPGKKMLAETDGGTKVILLDFDGHIVDNTPWNIEGAINCAPSGLTTQQQAEILNQTVQDYSAFDVIVTTDSALYASADPNRRTRCIYTTTYQWYGLAGGVAFIGSFSWGNDTPCFVFSSLLNYSTKKNQDAGSHEVGHTIGLYHQATYNSSCGLTSAYNFGQGLGETGWAPIMGVPYNQNMNTFFDGPNPYGCTNYQDDINIIAGYIPLRADDFSNEFAGANIVFSDQTRPGIIESKNDADMFELAPYGNKILTAELTSYNNIDGRLEVYNESGQLLLLADPPASLQVPVTKLPAGAKYIKVLASSTSPNVKQDVQLGRYLLKVSKVAK